MSIAVPPGKYTALREILLPHVAEEIIGRGYKLANSPFTQTPESVQQISRFRRALPDTISLHADFVVPQTTGFRRAIQQDRFPLSPQPPTTQITNTQQDALRHLCDEELLCFAADQGLILHDGIGPCRYMDVLPV